MAKIALAGLVMSLSGCHMKYVAPESPMPANTVLLSQMMRELSAQPGFTEALLKQLGGSDGKKGPAMMTPKLVDELRKRILGKDWSGLDRFPGWTMSEINPTVRTVGHFAGKSEKLEETAAVHPGASPNAAQVGQYLDVGPYGLDKSETVALDQPSTFPKFDAASAQTTLGDGVVRGDGANELAAMEPDSKRLADVLNRLAANELDGAESVTAKMDERPAPHPQGSYEGDVYASKPETFITMLQASGHTVTVTDSRYFANFGHFHYKGQDVMMPFWVDSQIVIPNSGGRHLLVPVSHAELEWHIRGPVVNADVSHYFGIDGKAEWRTMDTLDQPWVLKRDAHTYTGKDAVEVTRLAGLFTTAYMRLHAAHPTLPFGGYYALGVCQDLVSAIEHKMTGKSTLFPNTADLSLFNDTRDAEVNAMIAAIPKDRLGDKPEPERVFGSLPTEDFAKITIPGLADDLRITHDAWAAGKLERTHSIWQQLRAYILFGSALGLGFYFAWRTNRYMEKQKNTPVQRNPYWKDRQ